MESNTGMPGQPDDPGIEASATVVNTPLPQEQPDERTMVRNLIQAVVMLLPLLGVAVPAVFNDANVQWQLAGALMTLAGVVATAVSLFSHWRKNAHLENARAHAVHAKARAIRLERRLNVVENDLIRSRGGRFNA